MKKFFNESWYWIKNFYSYFLIASGTIGFASLKLIDGKKYLLIVLILSSLIYSFGIYVKFKREKRIENLQKEKNQLKKDLEKLDYYPLLRSFLSVFANQIFEFGDSERISIYKHEDNAFFMLERYSKNPKFTKPGRLTYPEDQGCISRAWNKGGKYFEKGLSDPKKNFEKYLKGQKEKYDIDEDIVKNFNMKSRSYYAFAIEEITKKDRIAVIFFESENINVLDTSKIQDELDKGWSNILAEVIMRMPIKDISETKKAGF